MASTKKSKISTKNKSKKNIGKIKKTAKLLVTKNSNTAKKGIKKLVKKAVAKNSKATKKVMRKHVLKSGKHKKAVSRIQRDTKAMMKPFSDVAIAVIDAVDSAMHSVIDASTKYKK